MELFYWTCVFIVFYVFIGYGILITLLAKFKTKKVWEPLQNEDLPNVTFVIAAYNEQDIIKEKLINTLNLDYPKNKLKILVVSDGSNDSTNQIVKQFPEVDLQYKPERSGKIAAVNRIMPFIKNPITVFSDANVMINTSGLRNMVDHFQSNLVGAVSGEKTVLSKKEDGASSSGEGFYWKYESYLKKKDSEWNTLVGSAGELFALRTHLYEPIDTNTLIEDFVMTMKLSANGYHVAYEPKALAMETGSESIEEETKRKVRISAGGIQAVLKLLPLLNFFKYGKLSFQYISHRALRWTLMPIAILGAFISIFYIADLNYIYGLIMRAQLFFGLLALTGYAIRNGSTKIKIVFIPYYFIYMHYCVVLGWFKYFSGNQKVTWDKAKRALPLEQV
ncbi:MAG TPA: glycosyltransferase family 2 protein [Roseivirga sp.]